jgi:hypothetical protein
MADPGISYGLPPRNLTFTRTVQSGSESIESIIDEMEMPLEQELRKYVVADETNVGALITDIRTILNNFKNINYATATLALNPSDHNVAYTSSLLTKLVSKVDENLDADNIDVSTPTLTNNLIKKVDGELNGGDINVTTPSLTSNLISKTNTNLNDSGVTIPDSSIANNVVSKAENNLANSAGVSIPSSSLVDDLVSKTRTNLNDDTTTGIPTSVETDMYNRLRARIMFEASRTGRRITEDISKKLPFAGLLADKLTEADQDVINAMNDVSWKITEKQADMTYDYNRKKIKEALEAGTLEWDMTQKQVDMDFALDRAEMKEALEAAKLKQDIINKQVDMDFAFDRAKIKEAIESGNLEWKISEKDIDINYALDRARVKEGLEVGNLEWKISEKDIDINYAYSRDRIKEALAVERLRLDDHTSYKGRWLQAFITGDENSIKNAWNEYEFEIRRALGYVPIAIDFALKAASGTDQITFENWLKMAKVMAEMQIQITGLVSNLIPSTQNV